MALVLVTPPAVEPVSTLEAKAHMLVEIAEDDALLDRLVRAARRHVEAFTGRALIRQTWELTRDAFPSGELELARGTVLSVVSVKYVDTSRAEQTLDPAAYQVDLAQVGGRLAPASGTSWPATAVVLNAVRVRFETGYGPAGSDVPEDIRQAILLLAAHWYENREIVVASNVLISALPFTVQALLSPHRVLRFG